MLDALLGGLGGQGPDRVSLVAAFLLFFVKVVQACLCERGARCPYISAARHATLHLAQLQTQPGRALRALGAAPVITHLSGCECTTCAGVQILVDVGAGSGLFSLAAAARGHQVLSFELSSKSLASLRASVEYNGFHKLLTLHEVRTAATHIADLGLSVGQKLPYGSLVS